MKLNITAILGSMTSSRFRRNTVVQVRANLLTQGLLLLATPILTRLFSPSDFGVAGLFSIAAAFVAAVATVRFDWSMPSAETERDAQVLLGISAFSTILMTLVLLGVFTIPDQKALFALVGLEPIPFAPLVPLLALSSSMLALLSSAYVRSGDLQFVSQSKYIQSGTQVLSSLSAGLVGMGASGLVISSTIAGGVGVLSMMRHLPKQVWLGLVLFSDYGRVARRYIRQASLSTAVNFVNFAFNNSLPLLLLFGYSAKEVGIYLVVQRLANTPALLISGGISSSFWSEAARLAKTDVEGLLRFYLKVVRRLLLLAMPLSIICLAGAYILPFVLGADDWHQAGVVLAACLPQILGAFIFSSTNHLIVYDRQGYQLISDMMAVAASVGALALSVILDFPFWAAVLSISIMMFLSYVLRFALHLKANREAVHVGSL